MRLFVPSCLLVVLACCSTTLVSGNQRKCVNAFQDVPKAVGFCSILLLGPYKLDMANGDPTGSYGNVCIPSGGKLQRSGSQIVTGTVRLEPGAEYKQDVYDWAGSVDTNPDLSTEIAQAKATSQQLLSKTCSVNYGKIDNIGIFDSDAIGSGTEAVVCIDGDAKIENDIILTGSRKLIFNIQGKLEFKAKVKVSGGMKQNQVIWNVVGGDEVKSSGGGGGYPGCCNAELDGTVLAPNSKVSLAPGAIYGQIIAGGDVTLASGSVVDCQDCKGMHFPQICY